MTVLEQDSKVYESNFLGTDKSTLLNDTNQHSEEGINDH